MELVCSVQSNANIGEVTMAWVKDGDILSNSSSTVWHPPEDPTAETVDGITTTTYNLTLEITSNDDHGEYQCVARNAFTRHMINFPISLTVLPQRPTPRAIEFVLEPPISVSVREGDWVVLTCGIRNGPFSVDWERVLSFAPSDFHIVEAGNNSITIANVQFKDVGRIDNGYYMCRAEDQQRGTVQSKRTYLYVSPPIGELEDSPISFPEVVTLGRGTSVSIACYLRVLGADDVGDPQLVIVRPGSPDFEVEGELSSEVAEGFSKVYRAILTIFDANDSNVGRYECRTKGFDIPKAKVVDVQFPTK